MNAIGAMAISTGVVATGAAIGASAADRHPAVGAAVGVVVSYAILWIPMIAFAGGLEQKKQVGTGDPPPCTPPCLYWPPVKEEPMCLGSVGGFP